MSTSPDGGWRAARIVFRKELMETLRDRRTLLIMILVPVLLYPALLVASEQLALFGRRQLEQEPASVALLGDVDEETRAFLERAPDLRIVEVPDPIAAVKEDSLAAALVWEETGDGTISRTATVFYDLANDGSRRAREVLMRELRAWGDTLLDRRLREQGLPAGFARPVVVADSSLAAPEEVGGYALGRFLPILLVVITLLGTFYPAIDLAAGEKERGTLETLLTAPVPSGQVVAGKFLTVAAVGMLAAALNLGSMLLTLQAGLFRLSLAVPVEFSLPFSSVLLIFATLVPLSVLFGALFLGVAVRSRSFKEAQNALTPVYMVVMLPALLPLFPGIDATPTLAVVPVAGVSLLFREVMAGHDVLFLTSLVLLSTLAYAAAALIFAADSFGREEVLFGGEEEGEVGGAWALLWNLANGAAREGPPSLRRTLLFVALVAILFFYLGLRIQAGLGEVGIVVSEVLLLLIPALLFVRLGGYRPATVFSLRRPSARDLFAGALVIAGGLPSAWLLAWLQSRLFPVPQDFLEGMSEFLRADSPLRLAWLLLLVALVPAFCEEAVFRGVLLAGTGRRLSVPRAILLNGLVFGLFHVPNSTVFRFLPSATLGVFLAWAVLRTRSIWTGVLMHALNNGVLVVLAAYPWLSDRFSDPEKGPAWWLLLPAFVALAVGGWLLESAPGGREPQAHGSPRGGGE